MSTGNWEVEESPNSKFQASVGKLPVVLTTDQTKSVYDEASCRSGDRRSDEWLGRETGHSGGGRFRLGLGVCLELRRQPTPDPENHSICYNSKPTPDASSRGRRWFLFFGAEAVNDGEEIVEQVVDVFLGVVDADTGAEGALGEIGGEPHGSEHV